MTTDAATPAVTTNDDPRLALTARSAPSPPVGEPPSTAAEGSLIGRFVAIITPFFAVFAGGIAAWVAKKVPGVHLDPGQIVAFMVAAATAALTAGFKFMTGWQQHEQNVADQKSPAIRRPAPTKPARATATK